MSTLSRFPYSGTFDIPRTSGTVPPAKNPPLKTYGDYCFRAQTELYHDGEEAATFTGYDKDFSIVENVLNVCKKFGEKRDGEARCSEPRLFFMGSYPECNGKIDVEVNLMSGKD